MKVRKTTFEEDLKEKEEAFLKLTGEERLRLMRKIVERMKQTGIDYQLKGTRLRIVRNP